MKTQTLTHIESIRLESLSLAEQTIQLLGWNWEQYTEHQFSEYCQFVDRICEGWYPEVRKQILYSPIFRGYWINEWNERTAIDWLPMASEDGNSHAYNLEEYFFLHDHMRLLNDDDFLMGYHRVTDMIRREEERYVN